MMYEYKQPTRVVRVRLDNHQQQQQPERVSNDDNTRGNLRSCSCVCVALLVLRLACLRRSGRQQRQPPYTHSIRSRATHRRRLDSPAPGVVCWGLFRTQRIEHQRSSSVFEKDKKYTTEREYMRARWCAHTPPDPFECECAVCVHRRGVDELMRADARIRIKLPHSMGGGVEMESNAAIRWIVGGDGGDGRMIKPCEAIGMMRTSAPGTRLVVDGVLSLCGWCFDDVEVRMHL